MEVTVTIDGMDKLINKIRREIPAAADKACVSAVNKLAAQGVTQGVKAITAVYNIKQRDVKKGVKLEKAARGNSARAARLFATIRGSGPRLPIYQFGALPKEPPSQKEIPKPYTRRKRASAKVLKQGGRKKFQHAFIAKMLSGHKGMFERTGEVRGRRSIIREIYTMGVAQMFKAKAVDTIKRLVRTKGAQVLKHELDYYLGKFRR